nr:hypothetical protein [Tanacetum cinerariifolium]
NPPIYVSCIKKFWASVSVKKTNDVVKLQALIDRKKVVVTEDTIHQDLRLDDADGVECLPNEEIFADMVRNVDSPSKFLMYPWFLQVMINAQVDDLSSHTTKYTSPALTQKVFANMRRIDKDDDDEVYVAPTPTSPTHEPLPPPQEPISSPPQALPTPTSSTLQEQPTQPTHTSESSMTLLNTLMKTCATLTQKVAHLEQDKVAQALEIVKLKQRMQEKHLDNIRRYQNLDNIRRYQNLKWKPISVVQARKNMVVYLNMARYKIAHFKGMTYDQKIIRVGGITQAYRSFKDMLKEFDREDLDALWRVTKEKFSTTMPTKDKEKVLLIELTRLVHQVSSTRRHDIFMFTEKDYPLTDVVLLLMLSTKLQVDEDCEMARDLVMKIFMEANKPKSRKNLDTSFN